jgi:hypothetical protein
MADPETMAHDVPPLIRMPKATTAALANLRDLNGSTNLQFDR